MNNAFLRFRHFFCTKMPFISLAGFVLSRLIYPAPKEKKSIDDYSAVYRDLIGAAPEYTYITVSPDAHPG